MREVWARGCENRKTKKDKTPPLQKAQRWATRERRSLNFREGHSRGLRVGNSREGARLGVEVRAMRGLIAGSAFQAKSSQAGVPVLLKANQLGCAAWSMALGLGPSEL